MDNKASIAKDVPRPPFVMSKHHKTALKTLLFAFHGNRQTLSYAELSDRIGVGEKTKAWQCVAWKELKGHEYIVASASDSKRFELSEKGVALASTLASDEELAEFKVPETNEELHEKIKAKLERLPKGRSYGSKILDLMLDPAYIPLNRNEMAEKFNVLADSHGFFYGLKALKEMKYVEFCSPEEISQVQRLGDKKVAIKKEEEATADTVDPEEAETSEPKKKKRKSTKRRTGGKPLKLTNSAYVVPPKHSFGSL